MQPLYQKSLDVKVNAFALISLLMKEFLSREALNLECRLKTRLERKRTVKNSGGERISQAFSDFVEKDFRRTLERRLSEVEKHFLEIKLNEFVDRKSSGQFRTRVPINDD